MRIPADPIGYLVTDDGILHTRYTDHATGYRTRTARGARNLLNGKRGRSCPDCYPAAALAPPDRGTPRPPQQRRPSVKN